MAMRRFKGNGPDGIPTRKQKRLLEESLNNPPETPIRHLAEKAGISISSVDRWFANKDFEHWWVMAHYEGSRGIYVEKIIRAVCERAIQPDASPRDRELALQILAPERLNKAKRLPQQAQIVVNFVGTEKRLDMPHVEGKLPPEPRLINYEEGDVEEEVIDVEAEVA